MGFIGDDVEQGIWMSLNGGAVLKTPRGPDLNEVELERLFKESKINSGGYGIIDVVWKSPENVWAVGGSGVVLLTTPLAHILTQASAPSWTAIVAARSRAPYRDSAPPPARRRLDQHQ